jgi:hypothetical protein
LYAAFLNVNGLFLQHSASPLSLQATSVALLLREKAKEEARSYFFML